METYFISADDLKNDAPTFIKSNYDETIQFNDVSGYTSLYNHIKSLNESPQIKRIITVGGSDNISVSTVHAMMHKYPDMHVLWIDCNDDLGPSEPAQILLDNHKTTEAMTPILFDRTKFMYCGLTEQPKISGVPFITPTKIKTLGIDKIVDYIQSVIENRKVHVCLDMKVHNIVNPEGLYHFQIMRILSTLWNNICSLDIVEFDKSLVSVIQNMILKLCNLKEKRVNLFSEDSWFLVYRPLEQTDPELDAGWYILRGLSIEQSNDILSKIGDDEIITLEIDDEEYLVTKTTVNEQNERTYFSSSTIHDVVLFPDEKVYMVPELINKIV